MSTRHPSRRATVVARWDGDRVLLQTADGSSVTLDIDGEMEDRLDVGVELRIELAADGTVMSWSFAEE